MFLGVVLAPGSTRVPSPATGSTALRTRFCILIPPMKPGPSHIPAVTNARARGAIRPTPPRLQAVLEEAGLEIHRRCGEKSPRTHDHDFGNSRSRVRVVRCRGIVLQG